MFLWVLAADGCFAILFALFGALTGAIRWRQGQPAGTRLGLGVARAFNRVRGEDLTPTFQGVLTGGTDGLVFGLVVGTLVGLVIGWQVPAEWQLFRPIMLTTAALAGCAVAFGLFAGLMTRLGTRATLGLFVGGFAGALIGLALGGLDGLLLGALAGAALGPLVSPRRGPPQDP